MAQGVSVIIPVYNVYEYLPAALESVLSQDVAEIEIIVVDDGSNAEAAARIAQACAVDPRITVLRQSNTGQAIARRNGMKQAHGEFILFLDADDILFPGSIAHLRDSLLAAPHAIAAYGTKIRIDVTGQFIDRGVLPTPEQAVSGDVLPTLLQGKPLLSNGSVCIRRRVMEQVTFPDTLRQGEDWVTWCRLAMRGPILYAGPRLVLGIRTHQENVSGEVLQAPSALFAMLAPVFADPAFAAHVGAAKLAQYRVQHIHHLHTYLRWSYTDRKQWLRAWYHKQRSLHWAKKLPRKTRVLHIVKWFYAGGAERLLSGLLQHSDATRYEHQVLSLSDQNERMGDVQHTLGVPYRSVEIIRNKRNILAHMRCFFLVRRIRPDVIKTWLPPSNITGGMLGKLTRTPVIWGIHDAQPTTPHNREKQRQLKLSHSLPRRIVCCSQPVYDQCVSDGYNPDLLHLIPNGTDTTRFSFQPEGRHKLRSALAIPDDTLLIGMAAEFTPIKRHGNFLAAAKIFLLTHPSAQFLFCGKDTVPGNPVLQAMIQKLGLENHVHLLGIRNDMADIYSALDIHTLNSRCESFGLAVTEAMACETYSIATDVGMLRELLHEVGEVIPVSDDPSILAEAWRHYTLLTEAEKHACRTGGRERIVQHYSLTETARHYDALYTEISAH